MASPRGGKVAQVEAALVPDQDPSELDCIAGPDRPAFDHRRSEAGVQQTSQNHLRAQKPRQVIAGLAAFLALALDLADEEPSPDELAEVDPTHQYLAS